VRRTTASPGATARRSKRRWTQCSPAASPQQYSPVEDGIPGLEIREFFIERFKQRVIFQVSGEDVLVVAVTHASRREGAWHRNLPTDLPPETT
jgi:hypothetical protein